MGIGLFGALQIGKEGLFTQQSAIGVTGHNIANVNTPGFSRQKPVIETMPAQKIGLIYFGRGAHLGNITKSYDKFLNNSIALETSILGKWETQEAYMSQTETIFNESSELGLNFMLNKFWDAWNDLAAQPEGIPERAVLQSTGQSIAKNLQNMSLNLETVRTDANNRLLNTVSQINQLSEEIAYLNGQVLSSSSQSANANDITDKRTLRVEELSKLIDTTVLEAADGQITVLTSSGRALVSENLSWQLTAKADADRDGFYTIYHLDNGVETDITDRIKSGSLKGILEVRDEIIPKYLSNLDLLASSLVTEVNKIHYQGYGLDGTTENYFFRQVTVLSEANRKNDGGGKIYDSQVTDPLKLVNSDFELKFVSSSPQTPKYEIYDTRNEKYIFRIDAGNSTVVFDDGGGDVIVSLAHGTYTASELAAELETQLDSYASTDQDYTVTYNATDRKFKITNKGTASIDIKWENSLTTAAGILGFNSSNKAAIASNGSVESDSTAGTYTYAAQLFEIKNGANDAIIFRDDGTATDRTATLDSGVYTSDQLAAEIKSQLEAKSGGSQTYTVSYSKSSQKFTITNDAANANSLNLLWSTSDAASTLGFSAVDSGLFVPGASDESDNARYTERIFQITGGNREINFNDSGIGGDVTASLALGAYTGEELAAEIEKQLESTSGSSGQDYIVTFDAKNGAFTIVNADSNQHDLNLLWSTSNAASTLGFDAVDSGAFGTNLYDVSDNVAGTVTTYDTIGFYGISVKLTDDGALPQNRDVFSISTVKNAAKTIEMDLVTATDPEKIAAAKDIFEVTGLNNTIVFDDDGDLTDGVNYKVVLQNGSYTPDELADEIELQLEQNGSGQSYSVRYDSTTNKFTVSSNPSNGNELFLLWENVDTTADFLLGFNNKIFTITAGSNDTINFDDGTGGGVEAATLTSGSYTGEELAEEIKSALESAGASGFEVSVAYNSTDRQFTITADSSAGGNIDLNWSTSNAASTIGFSAVDTTGIAVGSSDSSDFSPGRISASSSSTSEFATGGTEAGDNRNALKLADLRDLTVISKSTLSINTFYSIIVGEVGTDVDETNKNITHQSFVMEQYEQRREAISGVSIDEEMVNLIKYQQSFSASAKFITTLDQMLSTLLSIKS